MASDSNSKHTTTGYPAAVPPPPPPFTGVSHPYAAAPPPPPQPQPSYYYNQPYFSYFGNGNGGGSLNSAAFFLRRLLLILVAAFFFMGAVTFIVWLIIRPRVPQFSVSALSVSGFNISSNSISASFDLSFTAVNPNTKMSIDYSHVSASVFYDSYSLAETFLAPFSQSRRNSTSIPARMAAVAEYIDPTPASSLKSDRSGGNVEFNVRVSTVAKFRSGAWRTRNKLVNVFCGDVGVRFGSNSSAGSMTGPPKSCRVYM